MICCTSADLEHSLLIFLKKMYPRDIIIHTVQIVSIFLSPIYFSYGNPLFFPFSYTHQCVEEEEEEEEEEGKKL